MHEYSNIDAHARGIAAGILAPSDRLKRVHTNSPEALDRSLRPDADSRWSSYCERLARLIELPEDRVQLARLYHYSGFALHIFQLDERLRHKPQQDYSFYENLNEVELTCLLATRELYTTPGTLPVVETDDYHFKRFLRGMAYSPNSIEKYIYSHSFPSHQDKYIFLDTYQNLALMARLHFALLRGSSEITERDFEYNPALVQSLMLNLTVATHLDLNSERFSNEYHHLVYSNFAGLGKIIEQLELSEDAIQIEGGWFGPGDNKNDLTRFSSLLAFLNDRYSLEVLRKRIARTPEDAALYNTEHKIQVMKKLHPARKNSPLRLLLQSAGLEMISDGQIDASVKSGTRVFLRREPYKKQVLEYAHLAVDFLNNPAEARFAFLFDLLGEEAPLRVRSHLTDFNIVPEQLLKGGALIDSNITHYLMAFKSLFDPESLYSLPEYLRATKDGIRFRSQIKKEKDFNTLFYRVLDGDLSRFRMDANLLLYKPGKGVVLEKVTDSSFCTEIESNPSWWFQRRFFAKQTFAGIQLLAPISLPPSFSTEYGYSGGSYLDVHAEIIVVPPQVSHHHSFRRLFIRERMGLSRL